MPRWVVARVRVARRYTRLEIRLSGFYSWLQRISNATDRQIKHFATILGHVIRRHWIVFFTWRFSWHWEHARTDRGKRGGPIALSLRFYQRSYHHLVFYVPRKVCPYFQAVDQGARPHLIWAKRWKPRPFLPPMLYIPPERTYYPAAAGFHRVVRHPGVRPMHLVAKFNAYLKDEFPEILREVKEKFFEYLKRRGVRFKR
ncbi:MAG: hypothetical protein DRH17_13390 [Deltaproteobacteria bacterium]|nr:MAG: hypothetical protein DRH17_13390 [Deltaproteobacteria bacterium]